jgi:dienelactone hydrolase
LLSAHERQEASAADLRQKVRALRQELEAREKALELARRTVERLTGEKGQLEAGAAGAQGWCWAGW